MDRVKQVKQGFIVKELYRHPFAVPVITLVVLSAVTLVGLVLLGSRVRGPNDAYTVQVTADGQTTTVLTRALTVGDFLNRAEIDLHEGDVVEPSTETEIDAEDFRINVYRAKPVTIIDGETRVQALSAATTPRSIAAQVGIEVYPEDDIKQVAPDDILRDQVIGTQLVIDRAVPVNFNLYGTSVTLRTHVDTVGELLAEKNVVLAAGDSVTPEPNTMLKPNIQVFVVRKGTKLTTVEESIPHEVEYVDDNSLSFGTTAVRQRGSPGKKLVTYQLKLENGQEVGRTLIQSVTVSKPVTQIVARGKVFNVDTDKEEVMRLAGINVAVDYPYVDYIVLHESRWNHLAQNSSSGAYGLCQALPGNKMSSAGSDWQTNPVTQLKWCNGYATSRYGSWGAAYEFWRANHWW